MLRRKRRPWTPEELVVMNRFVQAIAEGRYDAIAKASRACLRELGRVRAGSAPRREGATPYTAICGGKRAWRGGAH